MKPASVPKNTLMDMMNGGGKWQPKQSTLQVGGSFGVKVYSLGFYYGVASVRKFIV